MTRRSGFSARRSDGPVCGRNGRGGQDGWATLAILPLTWTADGWPEVVADVGK